MASRCSGSPGGSLAVCLLMILSLLGAIAWFGFGTFWPVPVVEGLSLRQLSRDGGRHA